MREAFDLAGTPIRTTLREKANPFATSATAVVSEAASAQAADTPPARNSAAAFIFVTILLDMLALGLILPILPRLVESFVDNDTATAARIFGLFGTAWR